MIAPPVVVGSFVDLASGVPQNLDVSKFRADARRAILVKEIVFALRTRTQAGATGSDVGSIIEASLRTSNHYLTNGFIPVWLFAPRRSLVVNPALGIVGAVVSGQALSYSAYRWILPRPMYLPPGDSIIPIMQRRADADNVVVGNTRVWVGIIGAYADRMKKPKTSHVPYVSAAVFKANQLQSAEQDLQNVLAKPVMVQRLIGRIQSLVDFQGLNQYNPAVVNAPFTSGQGDFSLSTQTLSMRDSKGYSITFSALTEKVQWDSVFPPQTRSWVFRRELGPGEQYIVTLGTAPTTALRPMVSLVGYREEKVS